MKEAIEAPRPISNKTRIETSNDYKLHDPDQKLPDRFPTKQGLKLGEKGSVKKFWPTPRPISNKTRIETNFQKPTQPFLISPRPISNKTRIETAGIIHK